jgi:hypothetical protein
VRTLPLIAVLVLFDCRNKDDTAPPADTAQAIGVR